MSDLVGNPKDRFSHNEAHFILNLCNSMAKGKLQYHTRSAAIKNALAVEEYASVAERKRVFNCKLLPPVAVIVSGSSEPRHKKFAKTKAQISCEITPHLISAFVFAT